ncbi:hypothetical protein [Flavobacterium laiguense]|nr:hypothetical protein [Flavobacterium laiguense]
MKILIDFFASLYDLVIAFFASLYDLVYDFIKFLGDYLKWATDIRSFKSTNFDKQAKEPIQVHNQNPFDIR